MSSQFFGLTIAGSGLNAFQASINTTANNISNVDTDGYSRQRVEKTAASSLRVFQKFGSTSTGVKADTINRMRDQYYDEKYWSNQHSFGYYDKKEYVMDQIETYFNDKGDVSPGFSTIYGEMFDCLNEIATAAGDNSKRNSFVSSAQKFATYFNSTASRLEELQTSVNEEIKTTVDQVNAMAQKIALLNKQINVLEMEGGQANDLRDSRALILDQLSEIITIDTEEHKVANSNHPDMYTGATTFKVKVNGQILVDNFEYNTLSTVTRENRYNQSDVDGLYDIKWTKTGNMFNVSAKNQIGSLKALFEMRDGNDSQPINGISSIEAGGDGTRIVITSPKLGDHAITSINDLNLPETGYITVNNVRYPYDSWTGVVETTQDAITGEKTYNVTNIAFNLHERISEDGLARADGLLATVGQSVACKGVPYYQNQMNMFIRNFSEIFNDIQHKGQDLDEIGGTSFFVAESQNETENQKPRIFDFSNLNEDTKMQETSVPMGTKDQPQKFLIGSSAVNVTYGDDENYVLGGLEIKKDEDPNNPNPYTNNTYYKMTASNFLIASATVHNPQKLACTTKRDNGIDNNDLVPEMEKLRGETKLFRGGGGDQFLQCIYADITIDCEESRVFADNYKTIQTSIQKQRDSVSGVDEDEEAMDLVKFQNAYNLNSKVISVLAEMYDQLILNTAN